MTCVHFFGFSKDHKSPIDQLCTGAVYKQANQPLPAHTLLALPKLPPAYFSAQVSSTARELAPFLSVPAMARRLLEAVAGTPQDSLNSDLVVILAGLLCALVCVLGLGLVARCACSRRWVRAAGGGVVPPGAAAANRGVKKEVLRSLPTITYVSDGSKAAEEDECAICLAEFEDGQAMRVLPQCGHGFHAACVDTWLRSHSSCPSCRRVLVAELPRGEQCRRCGARSGGIGALLKGSCNGKGPTFLA